MSGGGTLHIRVGQIRVPGWHILIKVERIRRACGGVGEFRRMRCSVPDNSRSDGSSPMGQKFRGVYRTIRNLFF